MSKAITRVVATLVNPLTLQRDRSEMAKFQWRSGTASVLYRPCLMRVGGFLARASC
jgi:hypothetical protein